MLTKNPKREAKWLGAFVAAKLSTALFEDALVHGIVKWDVVFPISLSIIFAAALMAGAGATAAEAETPATETETETPATATARSGSVAKSSSYSELECLYFGQSAHPSIHLPESTKEAPQSKDAVCPTADEFFYQCPCAESGIAARFLVQEGTNLIVVPSSLMSNWAEELILSLDLNERRFDRQMRTAPLLHQVGHNRLPLSFRMRSSMALY